MKLEENMTLLFEKFESFIEFIIIKFNLKNQTIKF